MNFVVFSISNKFWSTHNIRTKETVNYRAHPLLVIKDKPTSSLENKIYFGANFTEKPSKLFFPLICMFMLAVVLFQKLFHINNTLDLKPFKYEDTKPYEQ